MATRTSPLEELTPRQREVLELVARGMTNGEIATHLGISLDGAKWHVSEIISRLGVDSRDEAAAIWRSERRPAARLRHWLGMLSPKPLLLGGGAAAGVAAGAVVAVAIALDDSSEAPPALTATPPAAAAGTATPPAAPTAAAGDDTATPATGEGAPDVTGLFIEPDFREPDETIELPDVQPPDLGDAPYEVYAYDADTGELRTFGFGSVPSISPDGRWMLWRAAPDGTDTENIHESGLPMEGALAVVELPRGEPRNLGDLGQSAWWYEDDRLLFWPEDEDLQSINLDTGDRRVEADLQEQYPNPDVMVKEGAFPLALPEGIPSAFDGAAGIDFGKDADVVGSDRTVRVQSPPGHVLFEFTVAASMLENAAAARSGYAAHAAPGEFIIPVPTSDARYVNLFALDRETLQTSFIATADVGAIPVDDKEGETNVRPASPLPLAANERYVAWTDFACGMVEPGEHQSPSTRVYDRQSDTLLDLGDVGLPAFFTEDAMLGLSATTWGADRLLDLDTFEFTTDPLPGIYNRWSDDSGVAVGGGYTGGHGGICA